MMCSKAIFDDDKNEEAARFSEMETLSHVRLVYARLLLDALSGWNAERDTFKLKIVSCGNKLTIHTTALTTRNGDQRMNVRSQRWK